MTSYARITNDQTPMTKKTSNAEFRSSGNLEALISKVFVMANGQRKEIRLPCSLVNFLEAQGLHSQSVVVEHNGAALAHSEYGTVQLADGDRLEIVRVVAGG